MEDGKWLRKGEANAAQFCNLHWIGTCIYIKRDTNLKLEYILVQNFDISNEKLWRPISMLERWQVSSCAGSSQLIRLTILDNYRKTCLVHVSSYPINYLPFDRWRLSPSRNSEFCASWKSALGHSSLNTTSRSFMCGLGFLSRGFYLGSWVFVLIKYTQNTSLV